MYSRQPTSGLPVAPERVLSGNGQTMHLSSQKASASRFAAVYRVFTVYSVYLTLPSSCYAMCMHRNFYHSRMVCAEQVHWSDDLIRERPTAHLRRHASRPLQCQPPHTSKLSHLCFMPTTGSADIHSDGQRRRVLEAVMTSNTS